MLLVHKISKEEELGWEGKVLRFVFIVNLGVWSDFYLTKIEVLGLISLAYEQILATPLGSWAVAKFFSVHKNFRKKQQQEEHIYHGN